MSLNSDWANLPAIRQRFLLFSLVAIVLFLLLVLRLWYLQIIAVDRYQMLSEKNRVRYVSIAAPRGPIYDRNGQLLVDSRPAFGVSVLKPEVEDRAVLFGKLSEYLQLEGEQLEKAWEKGRSYPRFRPVPLAEDVGRDVIEKIQENAIDLPGVLTEVRPLRAYPYGEMAAHVLGYLGEITESELKSEDFSGYRTGDYVGKTGVEKRFERELRGQDGERRVEVNVQGKELRQLKVLEARPGNRLFLTIDKDLQAAAEKAFGDRSGAVVALDVRTGEVLVLVSRPAFDPSLFAHGISGADWIRLLQDSRHPLQNKVVKGQYPPGSTFKPIVALAALRAGVASPSTTVNCTGRITLGNRDFRCWKKEGHGTTDLKKAIKESCDVWFYQVGLALGIDRLAAAARELGLGAPLGLMPEEKGGLMPDRSWKKKRFGESWYDGETLNAAIGQGFVLTTPLQLAAATAAIANGGKVYKPYLVKGIENWSGEVLLENHAELIGEGRFSSRDLEIVRRGMEAVVQEPGGTAWSSRLDQAPYAGKTGTAQVVRIRDERERGREATEYLRRDHALFVAYAPAVQPEVAVAVVVEHGGHGGSAAAPVARAIFSEYFGLTPKETPPAEEGEGPPADETTDDADGAAAGEGD